MKRNAEKGAKNGLREKIRQDLLDQLESDGTVGQYYTDLVDDYMSMWAVSYTHLGTGVRKITSRVTEVLASRIRTQCEADGLTLAQWMAICAEFYDERRGPGWTLQSYAPCISCGSHTSPDGCSCSRSADT